MTGAIVVFARAPARGQAKTRLVPALGVERAHALYRAMLADTLRNARASGARVLLAHTGAEGIPEARLCDAAFPQQGATFGDRFDAALADAHRLTRGPLVLVGADTPHLAPSSLRRAIAALEDAAAVVGVSREGGFHLVGFRDAPVPVATAFDEPNECAALLRILTRTTGAAPALAEPSFDLDVPQDLVELLLHAEVVEAAGGRCAAVETLAVLAASGLRTERTSSGGRERRLVVPPSV